MPKICYVRVPVPSTNLSGTATWNNSDIQTWLLLRTISGFVVLPQLESVLKCQAYVASKHYLETGDKAKICDFGV